MVGLRLGDTVGEVVGLVVSDTVGEVVGLTVGLNVGDVVGDSNFYFEVCTRSQ